MVAEIHTDAAVPKDSGFPSTLDVVANRAARKYSNAEMARRIVWTFVQHLYRYSPRTCFAWRSWLLRRMGAVIGKNVHVYPTARIYFPWLLSIGDDSAVGENSLIYNLGQVTIGRRTTVSHGAHICAGSHNYHVPTLPLLRPPIVIGDDVWLCADSFVGPGVTIGDGSIVGARAVAMKDVAPWMIVVGNPAIPVKRRILNGVGIE